MSSLSVYANAALYTGLFYLQGKVLYSIFVYDMPATNSSSSTTKAALQNAFDYYTTRKASDPSYHTAVPIACVLLTCGVFANVFFQRGSWASLTTFVVAFLTAFNNGQNVVDPVNALTADAKGEKEDLVKVLEGVTRGHWIDVIGFTAIFLSATYL